MNKAEKSSKNIAISLLRFVAYPSLLALNYTKSHMKSPRRTTMAIFFITLVIIWGSALPGSYLSHPTLIQQIAYAIVILLISFNIGVFLGRWNGSIRREFKSFSLPSRFEFINIEKNGTNAIYAILAINVVLGVVEFYGGTAVPKYVYFVPYALFLAGQYTFRIRIPSDQLVETTIEGVSGLKDLPKQHQSTSMILLREKIHERLHKFAPLMTINCDKILNNIYYVKFLGTDDQTRQADEFLTSVKTDLNESKDSRTMLDVVRNCKLNSKVIPDSDEFSFGWERRTDWWRRLDRTGQIIVVLTSLLTTIAAFHLLGL